jgi:hypothetical protein
MRIGLMIPNLTSRTEFAPDSPLEESGFEPLVPLTPKNGSDTGERDDQIAMSRVRASKSNRLNGR